MISYDSFLKKFDKYYENNASNEEPLFTVVNNLSQKQINGLYLEFGVWYGSTISYVAQHLEEWNIYGFDSFEGLPEKWTRNDDNKYEKGYFNLNGIQPQVPNNVNLVKGWFKETLPTWLEQYKNYSFIDLLHIDCDIYSSTSEVLTLLTPIIKSNTIIVFDELFFYPGYENHEIKALYEFIEMTKLYFEILYMGGYNSEKAAIIIM